MRPFEVAKGTTRVEVAHDWADNGGAPSTDLTQTVFDLGLWDSDGYRSAKGFRGWSGSRAGRVTGDQLPVFVQRDVAQRGYLPGRIDTGTWWVELGVAAVGPTGATWEVAVTCSSPEVGPHFGADAVDAAHVANSDADWYHGDFHMHGYHSNMNAPDWQEMVTYARSVDLDFLPITEYVTTQHWRELGPVQRANPDVLLWPGREIITYFGHANVLGETPKVVEYRHGFEDVTLGTIQAAAVAEGGLFQVNHPTTFEGPVFRNFCRGCEFELDDVIDWHKVTTFEVLTGPALVSPAEIGLPSDQPQIENPFMRPAIDRWEEQLRAGHKITAVSASDSKGVEDARRKWGTTATAVYARELSRAALVEALRAGRAYVQTRGAHASPALEMTVVTPDGQTGMFGDSFAADAAEVTVTVTGGAGQLLQLVRDGEELPAVVPITSDPFTHTFTADRSDNSGPLGTFWRVQTIALEPTPHLTTIGNPIFLRRP